MTTPSTQATPPLFDWPTERAAGVLLHPRCVPGDFGVGILSARPDRFLSSSPHNSARRRSTPTSRDDW